MVTLLMLGLPGVLFAMKYGPRIGVDPIVAALAYAALYAILAIAVTKPQFRRVLSSTNWLPFGILTIYLGVLFVVYRSIDPNVLQVDRWSAIEHFLDAVMRGSYPYAAHSHLEHPISGFPGLFLMALPFYAIGDVGLMQFVAVLALALLAFKLFQRSTMAGVVMLLISLPVVAYEIVVRSDLVSNMTLVAIITYVTTRVWYTSSTHPPPNTHMRMALLGLAWGLLLCTRGIVVVPFLLTVIPLAHNVGATITWTLLAGVALASAALFLPLYFIDPAGFIAHNPFVVQGGYIPLWLLAIVLVASVYVAYRQREAEPPMCGIAVGSGMILFLTIAACFALKVVETDLPHTIWGDGFDISYFALAVPFLVLHLGYTKLKA